MKNLKNFLMQSQLKVENVKYVASERILDDDKNPMEWEIRAITNAEADVIKKECTRKNVSRNGAVSLDFDHEAFGEKVVAKSTVYPELTNAELQNGFGVMNEVDLLKKMLLFGEYSKYSQKVLEINGLGDTLKDKIEEAKN